MKNYEEDGREARVADASKNEWGFRGLDGGKFEQQ